MRACAFAAAAWLGASLSCAALADAPGVATSGSAGATATQPGPASPPGTGLPPDRIERQGSAAEGAGGAKAITEQQVRQSMEAAGYADIEVKRVGDDWVGRGMLNGAPHQLRIDSRTGRAKR
jgi:hypothetical protein